MPYLTWKTGSDKANIINDDTDAALAVNRGLKVYRAVDDGQGGFDLIPQRVQAGTEVFKQVFLSATLEDDI